MSVAAHAAAALFIVGAFPAGRAAMERLAIDHRDSAQPVRPGDDASAATTITWIGYEEYEEHLARLAEVDQPAETPQPSAGSAGLASAGATGSFVGEDRPREGESTDAAPLTPPPTPVADALPLKGSPQPTLPARAALDSTARRLRATAEAVREDAAAGVDALVDAASRLTAPLAAALQPGPASPASPPKRGEPDTALAEATGEEAQAPPASEPEPAQAREAIADGGSGASGGGEAPGPEDPRRPTDRDSIATAVVNAEVVRPGKPLSAKGLRITTVAPELADVTYLLTRSRKDQVVRAAFGSDGRVRSAVTLRSSGFKAIDEAGLNAVYNWRAEGEGLKSLKAGDGGATVTIDFRIVL